MTLTEAIAFMNEAAIYFETRDTHGEDKAHWSNVYNAQNCRAIIDRLVSSTTPSAGDAEYHYTRDGRGIVDAVCKMFSRGTFLLDEGDALLPVQEAYQQYKALKTPPSKQGG